MSRYRLISDLVFRKNMICLRLCYWICRLKDYLIVLWSTGKSWKGIWSSQTQFSITEVRYLRVWIFESWILEDFGKKAIGGDRRIKIWVRSSESLQIQDGAKRRSSNTVPAVQIYDRRCGPGKWSTNIYQNISAFYAFRVATLHKNENMWVKLA